MSRGTLTAAPIRAPAWLRYVLVLLMGLAAVTLFLLATAAANTQLFAHQYALLLSLNGAIALVLALLATIYPAWRAAKVNPAEALRYE